MQYYYSWAKESKSLEGRLSRKELKNDEEIKNFYWENDMLKNSSKAKIYKKYHFDSTRSYIYRSVKYPDYTLGFLWLLRIRCGY